VSCPSIFVDLLPLVLPPGVQLTAQLGKVGD
jgi:hypothetical protein